MLCLVCPCGHSAPLPESSGRFTCSKCKRVQELAWFEAPAAFKKYFAWRLRTGRLAGTGAESPRIEFIPQGNGDGRRGSAA